MSERGKGAVVMTVAQHEGPARGWQNGSVTVAVGSDVNGLLGERFHFCRQPSTA